MEAKGDLGTTPRLNDPRYWIERAEEARVTAESFTDRNAREALMEVAKHYDYLAESAAQRLTHRNPIIGQ